MPSCNAEDFVLYFFLCFRSLRDRAPASDAGSGGSSPFGSIFCCKSSYNITPAVSFLESTLSLGSGLTVLSIKLRFARFLQVPRPPNGFLKRIRRGLLLYSNFFRNQNLLPIELSLSRFRDISFIENSFPNGLSLSHRSGYFT